MSHVVRCDVFKVDMDAREEWLEETLAFMAERYPGLSELQMAQLDVIGRRFIKPPIRHGADHSASTRDANLADRVESEIERRSA